MKAKTKLPLQSWKPTFLFMEPYLEAILFEKLLSITFPKQLELLTLFKNWKLGMSISYHVLLKSAYVSLLYLVCLRFLSSSTTFS